MSTSQETKELVDALRKFIAKSEDEWKPDYISTLHEIWKYLSPTYVEYLQKKIERLEKENSKLRFYY